MGRVLRAMTAEVRFNALLAPVLTAVDDAQVAVTAARLLRAGAVPTLDVMPLSRTPELDERTVYALLGDAVAWHAVWLLIEQGKLPANARLPVRIFLDRAQWRQAGLVARIAELAHRTPVRVERPRRGARVIAH